MAVAETRDTESPPPRKKARRCYKSTKYTVGRKGSRWYNGAGRCTMVHILDCQLLTQQPIHYRGTVPRENVGCPCRLPACAQTREQSNAWQHEVYTFHQTVAAAASLADAAPLKQDDPSVATAAALPTVSVAMTILYPWVMTTTVTPPSSRPHTAVVAAKAVLILPRHLLPLPVSVWRGQRGYPGRSMRAR
jgi:hypothetical protein